MQTLFLIIGDVAQAIRIVNIDAHVSQNKVILLVCHKKYLKFSTIKHAQSD